MRIVYARMYGTPGALPAPAQLLCARSLHSITAESSDLLFVTTYQPLDSTHFQTTVVLCLIYLRFCEYYLISVAECFLAIITSGGERGHGRFCSAYRAEERLHQHFTEPKSGKLRLYLL